MESTVGQEIGVRELLESGVHFGHQARRWNPKMKRYVFAERAGVHIIDLDQTLTLLDDARRFVRGVAEAGREVLFVGTKKQAQFTIAEQAVRSGQPYVVERYIGGMLTNFQTIQPRIEYFKTLMQTVEETPEEERTGREWFALYREYQKLRRNFAGITEMERLPGAVFVIDPKKEELLIKEANRLKIPVVALTDTNCDPEVVDYVIPGNDDAIRSIDLVSRLIADAILEGRGEDVTPPDDRPVPPAVEDARVDEERATEPLPEAAEEGGLTEDQPTGLADPIESAGEIRPEEDPTTMGVADPFESAGEFAPEEDPTTSYSDAPDRQESADEDVPDQDALGEDVPGEPEPGSAGDGGFGAGEAVVDESAGGESAGEFAPEEDPTTSYSGALEDQESVGEDVPVEDVPDQDALGEDVSGEPETGSAGDGELGAGEAVVDESDGGESAGGMQPGEDPSTSYSDAESGGEEAPAEPDRAEDGEFGSGEAIVDESTGGESAPDEPAPVESGLPEGGMTQATGGDNRAADEPETGEAERATPLEEQRDDAGENEENEEG